MAERISAGFLSEAIRVDGEILEEETPVAVRETTEHCVITVMYGEFNGLSFILTHEQVERCVTLVL